MEKTLVSILIAFALIIGVIGGVVIAPAEEVEKEVIVKEIVNVSVVEFVEAPSDLDKAVEAFLKSVEDEEDEAGNDVDVLGNYNFDEVEVLKVYDEYNVSYDDDVTIVNFAIRLLFDDGDDREKNSYDVEVIFEEAEDTEVTVA